MAKKDRYNKVKPQISMATIIIVALIFIGLVLTIVFSIDTPKQKFDKQYGLEKNNYTLISLSKLEKEIEKGNKLVVIIKNADLEGSSNEIVTHLLNAYTQEDENYKDVADNADKRNTLKDDVSKLYFVTVSKLDKEKNKEQYDAFIEKYELSLATNATQLISFNNKEVVTEYKTIKNAGEISDQSGLIFHNMRKFVWDTSKKFAA